MPKKKIENLIKQLERKAPEISKIAEEEKWEFEYDRELDYLYLAPKKIPNSAQIFNLTDEYAVYALPNGDIKGLLIEYFRSNFVKHNREFEGLMRFFTKPKKGFQKIDKRKEGRAKIYKKAIEQDAQLSIRGQKPRLYA